MLEVCSDRWNETLVELERVNQQLKLKTNNGDETTTTPKIDAIYWQKLTTKNIFVCLCCLSVLQKNIDILHSICSSSSTTAINQFARFVLQCWKYNSPPRSPSWVLS